MPVIILFMTAGSCGILSRHTMILHTFEMIICKEVSDMDAYDVVIVGSGTSGQTAAFKLKENCKSITNRFFGLNRFSTDQPFCGFYSDPYHSFDPGCETAFFNR
jgi:hypothetical protein